MVDTGRETVDPKAIEGEAPDEGAAAPTTAQEPGGEEQEGSPHESDQGTPATSEEASEAVPAAGSRKLRWYVVHAYSGHENKVKGNLEKAIQQAGMQDRIPQVLVPTESVTEMKDGKRSTTTRKAFPSYVLVQMEMSDDAWHLVTNTPGVTKFLGAGNKPQPLMPEEVKRILATVEGTREKPTPEVPFRTGDHVRVIDGPFTDFTGVVGEVNAERGKLKVMVSIFGRATPVELDFLQVKSI